jgi:hypothetical protein
MVSRDSHYSFPSSERSKPGTQPLKFVRLLIDQITHKTNKVGRPLRNSRRQFGKFRVREEESQVKVAENRQSEAIQVGPTPPELNLDGAEIAGTAQTSPQHLARKRVLQRAEKTRHNAAERT